MHTQHLGEQDGDRVHSFRSNIQPCGFVRYSWRRCTNNKKASLPTNHCMPLAPTGDFQGRGPTSRTHPSTTIWWWAEYTFRFMPTMPWLYKENSIKGYYYTIWPHTYYSLTCTCTYTYTHNPVWTSTVKIHCMHFIIRKEHHIKKCNRFLGFFWRAINEISRHQVVQKKMPMLYRREWMLYRENELATFSSD